MIISVFWTVSYKYPRQNINWKISCVDLPENVYYYCCQIAMNKNNNQKNISKELQRSKTSHDTS